MFTNGTGSDISDTLGGLFSSALNLNLFENNYINLICTIC